MIKAVQCFTLLTVLAVAQGSLLDALLTAHSNPAFQHLPAQDRIIIIELIAEVEAGEVKAYIDQAGLSHVLAAIDKLPEKEAHVLTAYLIEELKIEEGKNSTSTLVGKRDLVSTLNEVRNNPTFQHLPLSDQKLVERMITEAENNTLTALVQEIGYSAILDLLDALPNQERHDLERYLIDHLDSETALLG